MYLSLHSHIFILASKADNLVCFRSQLEVELIWCKQRIYLNIFVSFCQQFSMSTKLVFSVVCQVSVSVKN